MENGMDVQMQVPNPLSSLPRTYPEHSHTDNMNADDVLSQPAQACEAACQNPPSQCQLESTCDESLCRAPPRVDSCPDMDTRPPLTPELIGMELDAQQEEALPLCSFHMQELVNQLPSLDYETGQLYPSSSTHCSESDHKETESQESQTDCSPCPLHIVTGKGLSQAPPKLSESSTPLCSSRGLFMSDTSTDELLSLFQYEDGTLAQGEIGIPLARLEAMPKSDAPPTQNEGQGDLNWNTRDTSSTLSEISKEDSSGSLAEVTESAWEEPEQPKPLARTDMNPELSSQNSTLAKVPGPCDPEDLLDGVIFGAKYLGSTQLNCEKHPATNTRMRQAQEAVDRVKAPDGESQPMTEVDIMVSTKRVKVLTADTQETLMEHPLQTISYTADIGSILVLMARRKSPRGQDQSPGQRKPHKMLCHVFQSNDAQLIAQAIGQAFGLAYQNFLLSEGGGHVEPGSSQAFEQLYNADLAYFSKSDNCREVYIQKQRGEMLGVAVVESGWGSLLPTVVIANLMHGGPAERSGELSIGDHVTSINRTSLVGLPLSASQALIRELKGQSEVILNIVRCPPVITAIIQRPDASHQLGFCVEDGVICSLVRGGIAERGGIRVGHRIIEINGQSVVATAHEKIIQTLLEATGEVHIKTMPASTYRLLTGQETPVYL
ncbi:amyloid-beta A4 precursor protein-binding family A member 3 [Spea bombifrons]|uniref:amyloid-beta A4 precursor protein-binding family A member 3 n=1 Tax=Spea bombifrons TaxID=233779 RepID=UPI002349D61B|nr:amyloid-beta A4 precursor protein-binding family A member 3 [Spea bombifrons]XP_053317900.1 amyloid-beta A4 precursor protein-binding family A member 3 [Spea bombifrons]